MITQASGYLYTNGDVATSEITGDVMPLRAGVAQKVMRGEDIAFLQESLCERIRAREATAATRRFSRIQFKDQLDNLFSDFNDLLSQGHGISNVTPNPDWTRANLCIHKDFAENYIYQTTPPSISDSELEGLPNFYKAVNPISYPYLVWEKARFIDPVLQAFANQKDIRVFLDTSHYALTNATPTQVPNLPESQVRTQTTWNASAPYADYGTFTYSSRTHSLYSAPASAANHIRREDMRYLAKVTRDPIDATWVWQGSYKRSRNANSTVHVTRDNLPIGAIVTPIVLWQSFCLARWDHGSNQTSFVQETYNSGHAGLVFATPKTADSSGTVTFTWNELRTDTGGSGSSAIAWDDIPSRFPLYIGYNPQASISGQYPPFSELYSTYGDHTPWYADYTAWQEYSLLGLLIDLGDHTKWWNS